MEERTLLLDSAEKRLLRSLSTPAKIQEFLDRIPYSSDPIYRSPRSVIRDRKAHCFDGAVFAAAALQAIGELPLIMELKAVRDDDHLLALFRRDGCWGAVAKSNFVGLRYREAIFRNLRELSLSYFEEFYNINGEKTLRAYSAPLDLGRFAADSWQTIDSALDRVAGRLDRIRHYPLLTRRQERGLAPVDERFYRAGLLGADEKGLFKPEPNK